MVAKPLSQQWREAADEWCDLEAAADLLESTKSSVLSQMMLAMGDMPISKAEAKVKAGYEWGEHVKRISEARRKANKAKVAMEYHKLVFYEAQSRAATERLEARI